MEYRPIEKRDLPGVIRLLEAENWAGYAKDPDRTWRALTAPGTHTIVAVEDDGVVGFASLLCDGYHKAHLCHVLVAPSRRREGIGTHLIKEAFRRSRAEYLDVVTETPDAAQFYRSFAHYEWYGFRIHPQYEKEPFPPDAPADADDPGR